MLIRKKILSCFQKITLTICTLFKSVRENRRDNQEWTIQRHGQHWTQDTKRKKTKEEEEKNVIQITCQ